MKNISNFELTSLYNQALLERPHVSLTLDDYEIHYDPIFVEIGGVKWATKNLGASSITDVGLYFLWGDTKGYTSDLIGSNEGQKYFGWNDYKWGKYQIDLSPDYGFSKYNNSDDLRELLDSDESAKMFYLSEGVNWRMPTIDEFNILLSSITSTWYNNYQDTGVSGMLFTDKSDSNKKLFFPNGGGYYDGEKLVSGGNYWSSSLSWDENPRKNVNAFNLLFTSNRKGIQANNRLLGCNIRPVLYEH